jgi:hypothetical protein
MSRALKTLVTQRPERWIGKRLLITSAVCFAGAIVSSHYLLKTRSEGNLDAMGRWAFVCLALYFIGMSCISFPLAKRAQERYAKKRAQKRALEREIELKRKFEHKKTGGKRVRG